MEYAHFLERFGDAAYRPDGKLKRPEDFTDFRHRDLAERVWREGKQPRGQITDYRLSSDGEEAGPTGSAPAPGATPDGTGASSPGAGGSSDRGALEGAYGEISALAQSQAQSPLEVLRGGGGTNFSEYYPAQSRSHGPEADLSPPSHQGRGGGFSMSPHKARALAEARCREEYERKVAAAERRRKRGRTLNAIIYGARRAEDIMPKRGPGGQRQYTMPDPDIPETVLELDDYWKTSYEEDMARAREEYRRGLQEAPPACAQSWGWWRGRWGSLR